MISFLESVPVLVPSSTSKEVKEKDTKTQEKEHAQAEGIYFFFLFICLLAHLQSVGDVNQPPLTAPVPPSKLLMFLLLLLQV